jgi:hypothetical protein
MTNKRYSVTITEAQRRLIMQALGTAIANSDRSSQASGSLDNREEIFELICIFSTIPDEDTTSN